MTEDIKILWFSITEFCIWIMEIMERFEVSIYQDHRRITATPMNRGSLQRYNGGDDSYHSLLPYIFYETSK